MLFCYMDVTKMIAKHLVTYGALIALLNIMPAYAQSMLDQYYLHFKQGQYKAALVDLENITHGENSSGTKAYLTAITLSRLQEYDSALKQFESAIADNNESPDLYYEYGQALYAANEIKKAREAFKISVSKKFNLHTSLYYVAHISQILEEYDLSKDIYLALIKEKNLDLSLKQISHFQLSESLLSIARAKSKNQIELTKRVEKFILPMLDTAFALDKSTDLAHDIQNRRTELYQEFKLDPNLLENGRRVSAKRLSLSASQEIKFDDNITLINEENNVQQSKKESYVFETELHARYDYILKKKYIISPDLRLSLTQHSDRSSPEVYQNGSMVVNLNLKNKLEHKFKDQPASLIFDIDTTQIYKDWNQKKKKEFYANSMTIVIGESFNFFSVGESTIKLKLKDYEGKNTEISNKTKIVSMDQTYYLSNQHLLIGLFEMSLIDNFNSPTTSTDTYLLRFDYIIPSIMPDYTLNLAMAVTMTDTKLQKAVRGTELSYNPSTEITKKVRENIDVKLNFDLTKTKSKETSYSYRKSSLALGLEYNF